VLYSQSKERLNYSKWKFEQQKHQF